MIFGKLSDIFFGKIGFSASEGFTDIFLSDCRKNGIILYDVKKTADGLSAYIRYTDADALFYTAAKSGTSIEVTKRYGLPDLFLRYRKRLGIPVGFLVLILILAVLSSMIWSVDIAGAENIPEEDIFSALDEFGVKTGVFSASVNCKDIEFSLYKRFEKLSWVSVTVIGSRAFVTVRERSNEENIKEEIYSNIVAAKDGEIVRAEIFCGEGKIYQGTAVVKGDLLVSGVKTHRDESVEFVQSEAKIYARTKNHISSFTPMNITADKKSVCKDNYFLFFFGLEIPLGRADNENTFTQSKYFLQNSDVIFPIGLIREHHYSYSRQEIKLTENEAQLIAFRDFSLSAMKLYENAEILEKKFAVTLNSGAGIECSFLCIEDIALEKIFTVETEE